jgi:phosphotransferase system enzyme I (PtsP)
VGELALSVDDLFWQAEQLDKEQKQVLEAYRMFAHSRGWLRRMEEDIMRGPVGRGGGRKGTIRRPRPDGAGADQYLRERLQDLDDLSNRLLRILTGQGKDTGAEMPDNPILIARNIGPANCWNTAAS